MVNVEVLPMVSLVSLKFVLFDFFFACFSSDCLLRFGRFSIFQSSVIN